MRAAYTAVAAGLCCDLRHVRGFEFFSKFHKLRNIF
jgi:hypothetical protein